METRLRSSHGTNIRFYFKLHYCSLSFVIACDVCIRMVIDYAMRVILFKKKIFVVFLAVKNLFLPLASLYFDVNNDMHKKMICNSNSSSLEVKCFQACGTSISAIAYGPFVLIENLFPCIQIHITIRM